MTTKTYDRQTAKFIARIAENIPEMSSDVMQGWIDNPRALQKLLDGLNPPQVGTLPAGYLRKISGDFTLPATTNSRTIATSRKTFSGYLDSHFADLGPNVASPPTPATSVEVHEQVKNGTFASIFGSVGKNLDDQCFTQEQIISFVEAHSDCLHPQGYGTFFLFKVNGKFFVAGVDRRSDGRLNVDLHRLEYDRVWDAEYRSRVVMPKLATSLT